MNYSLSQRLIRAAMSPNPLPIEYAVRSIQSENESSVIRVIRSSASVMLCTWAIRRLRISSAVVSAADTSLAENVWPQEQQNCVLSRPQVWLHSSQYAVRECTST